MKSETGGQTSARVVMARLRTATMVRRSTRCSASLLPSPSLSFSLLPLPSLSFSLLLSPSLSFPYLLSPSLFFSRLFSPSLSFSLLLSPSLSFSLRLSSFSPLLPCPSLALRLSAPLPLRLSSLFPSLFPSPPPFFPVPLCPSPLSSIFQTLVSRFASLLGFIPVHRSFALFHYSEASHSLRAFDVRLRCSCSAVCNSRVWLVDPLEALNLRAPDAHSEAGGANVMAARGRGTRGGLRGAVRGVRGLRGGPPVGEVRSKSKSIQRSDS
eukprot:753067-Hanusia_phi.AAC.8